MSKKRIALITAWFPPLQGIAVSRMKAFAHYLSEDFEVDVFTMGTASSESIESFGKVYYESGSKIHKHIKHKRGEAKTIHHCKTALNLLARRLNSSEFKSWEPRILGRLNEAHAQAAYDVIISSYAPVEAHEVAYAFVKKNAQVPWVADMRDGMSKNPYLNSRELEKLAVAEKKYAEYLTAVCSVSDPIIQDFREIFPGLKQLWEIRNGFDHDMKPLGNFNEVFTMVFAGTFYGKRKPTLFLNVLSKFASENPDFKFKLLFIGTHRNFSVPPSIEDSVFFVNKVPYPEAIEYMRQTDCNLMISPPVNAMGQFTGKLFDYLSVEKPILAMMDKSDVGAKLIEEHHAGIVSDFYDEEGIEQGLKTIYTLWQKKERLPIDSSKTSTFHRKHQVLKLAANIKSLLEE